jgi:hypothetical protein
MTGKSNEDGDICLNTNSGDTRNDLTKCVNQFAKAFHNKGQKLRSHKF